MKGLATDLIGTYVCLIGHPDIQTIVAAYVVESNEPPKIRVALKNTINGNFIEVWLIEVIAAGNRPS